jgi:hypothetical protein
MGLSGRPKFNWSDPQAPCVSRLEPDFILNERYIFSRSLKEHVSQEHGVMNHLQKSFQKL